MNEDVQPKSSSADLGDSGGRTTLAPDQPGSGQTGLVTTAVVLDPAVASLCVPVADGNQPCGPDLDLSGDADYLNFFAQVEGILPSSFFNSLDGTPFDPSSVNIDDQLLALKPLIERSRDIRLLVVQARLHMLNRDMAGFATSLAAIAYWLDGFWDQVHPVGDAATRLNVIATLNIPTVTFSLQYAPLFEAPRIGTVTYRSLLIATGEAKPRTGEQKLDASPILEARATANAASLRDARENVAAIRSAIDRMSGAFATHGATADLDSLSQLVAKIQAFIDPVEATKASAADSKDMGTTELIGPGPRSFSEARDALAAIADYYSRHEPSSPTLPLVRQAHELIGKSFLEVIRILVPAHLEKAAFQIGGDRIFDLPVERLPNLSSGFAPSGNAPSDNLASEPVPSDNAAPPGNGESEETAANAAGATGTTAGPIESAKRIQVSSRAQAIAVLDQVQRYFRLREPSSPVPMLLERARAFAERDFMAVLREVLPKAALRDIGADK